MRAKILIIDEVRTCIGCAAFPDHRPDRHRLIKTADQTLNAARSAGRDCARWAEERVNDAPVETKGVRR